MKLGTHVERLAALESATEGVANAIELATLVQLANQLVREDGYASAPKDIGGVLTAGQYADMRMKESQQGGAN